MTSALSNINEYDAISKIIQCYVDGGRQGRGDAMRPAFHQDATICGYANGEMFAGPIQKLFDHVDQEAPASGVQARLVSVDIIDTIAVARLELDGWNGHRYTDVFTLLNAEGEWTILNKVFHQYS